MNISEIINIDNDILGGQPVFKGTRVPVESLFDHLEAGVPLDEFLDDFPTVSKEQVIALLDMANKLLTSKNAAQLYATVAWRKFTKTAQAWLPWTDIFTVRDKQWNGIKNGELLKLLLDNSFNALLTFDKNLQHQQNFLKYTITIFVLTARINQYSELTKLTPKVKKYLSSGQMPIGPVIIASD